MARKQFLSEAHKKETETLMEGWMSQAGEDHRRLANKLEAIGLQPEDFVETKKHDKQSRSSEGDYMRNLSSVLDSIAEGTFGPHNLPGADKKDDSDDDDDEVTESCGCDDKDCKGDCGKSGCSCGS